MGKKAVHIMRFESKNKALLPLPQFLHRMFRYFIYSFMMIIVSLGIGTLGYSYFGGLSAIDGFYNACMILTGMGPVNAMETHAAKLFSSLYALFSGIAFLSTVAVLFAPMAHRFLHLLHIDETDNTES
jgi:hypothetical protein